MAGNGRHDAGSSRRAISYRADLCVPDAIPVDHVRVLFRDQKSSDARSFALRQPRLITLVERVPVLVVWRSLW